MEQNEEQKELEVVVPEVLPDAMINKNTSFHGNPLLKSSREPVALTQKHIDEIKKCMDDPIYFAENYIKIVNVDEGLINITLYPYQKRILQGYKEHRYCITLSCRQSGKCLEKSSKITLRHKKYNYGEPFQMKIGDFYAWQAFRKHWKDFK